MYVMHTKYLFVKDAKLNILFYKFRREKKNAS